MGKLIGKVCIITGGAGSVGLAAARLFIAEGAKVMLVDLASADPAKAAATLDDSNAAATPADVTRPEDVHNAVAATVARWGKIDVVLSNAGNFGVVAPIESYPEDIFESVHAVHVRGAFLACKYAVPQMNDGGSIIITSSIVGTTGAPGVYAYVTAKHAQVGLMRSLAKELARRRIRVNTLHPGPIDNSFQAAVEANLSKAMGRDATAYLNDVIPLGRHARPDEIARSILYLASDDSSFVTGTTLMADGGMSA